MCIKGSCMHFATIERERKVAWCRAKKKKKDLTQFSTLSHSLLRYSVLCIENIARSIYSVFVEK